MVSGSTALTVALVPTAMKAGVWMSPCGVWITPARPDRPGNSATTSKNSGDGAFTELFPVASLAPELFPVASLAPPVDSYTMRILLTVVALAALGVLAGCSSPPPAKPQPGTLVVGTAAVTVNDVDAGSTDAVACTAAGALTTITTGDAQSGVTALVSNKDELTAESVSINNLGGFTGSYNAGLGGEATVTMTGRTYDITGTADGFATDNPSFRTNGTFTIKVAC